MPNFYYIIVYLLNGEKQTLEGRLNYLNGPDEEGRAKFQKLVNTLENEKKQHWIRDFHIGYES